MSRKFGWGEAGSGGELTAIRSYHTVKVNKSLSRSVQNISANMNIVLNSLTHQDY